MKYLFQILVSVTLLSCAAQKSTTIGMDSMPTKPKTTPNSKPTTVSETKSSTVTTIYPFINLTSKQAEPMMKDPLVTVIDLRTLEEISEGYIDGTDKFLDFYTYFNEALQYFDKNKKYLLYCQSGGRSEEAAQRMVEDGFRIVYNLEPGIDGYKGKVVQE